MSESTGGVGGAGESGAGGVGGVSGADRASESSGLSSSERSEVSAAAASTSASEVSAQADQVAGAARTEDGFDRDTTKDEAAREEAAREVMSPAGTAGLGRGPSEGTLAERDRREAEATVAAGGVRGPSEGTLAERERREAEATTNSVRGPSEGTLAERERRDVDAIANRLAESSPTARGLVDNFRAAGGTFVHSERGSFFDRNTNQIHVAPGTPEQRMQLVAHELGHFDYRNNPDKAYAPPGRPDGVTDRQIEHRRQAEYITTNVNRQLADEGHASVINRQIRDEVFARTGVDIGINGNDPRNPMTFGGTIPEQRRTLGDYFGANNFTSTTGENYRSYYGRAYIEHYARHHLPGQER
ncbi:hypothetical protein L6R52_24890 [Myxococcota bacterium]|nr:hypothetical protein [Myxococcota bacterium]